MFHTLFLFIDIELDNIEIGFFDDRYTQLRAHQEEGTYYIIFIHFHYYNNV